MRPRATDADPHRDPLAPGARDAARDGARVLRRRSDSLTLLAAASVRLLMHPRPEELVPELLARLATLLRLDLAFNYLIGPDGAHLSLNASVGVDDDTRALLDVLPVGQAVCGLVAQAGDAIVVDDAQASSDPRHALIRRLGVSGYACFPLAAESRLLGTLSFGRIAGGRFDDEELALLRTASDQLALALDRQRLVAELRAEVDERRRAEEDLVKFKLATEHSNDAHFLFDERGRVCWANRLACERLGYTLDELTALTVGDINPHVPDAAFGAYFARARVGRVPPFELEHRRKDGSTFPVEITPTVVELPDGPRLFAAVRDITERKQAEAERECLLAAERRARADAEAARERTARLQSLTAALAVTSTEEEVAAAVVAYATDALGAVGTVIARLSADGRQLEIMRANDMPDAARDAWRRFPVDAAAPLAEVARTGRPIFLASRAEWTARYPHLAESLEAAGHHANAVAPLVVDGRVLGVLGAAFGAPREFGDDDRAQALTVAAQCAQALERARLFDAERAARRDAEAANRSKSDFLAVMSHELRTPLNAIGGYAELMEMGIRGPVTPQQCDDLRRIKTSQRHLLGLINEVLNYAKLETGRVHYDVADLRVCEAIAAAEGLVAPQARAKGLALAVGDCPPDVVVRADGEKLRQVLVNLLSNAVKFTEPGGRIELACGADGARARVVVSDTGIGIPADRLDDVFEPFVQVRAELTRTQEGTGLGLAISRDLARGMGGDLTAESVVGVGSTFTLTLPLAGS